MKKLRKAKLRTKKVSDKAEAEATNAKAEAEIEKAENLGKAKLRKC